MAKIFQNAWFKCITVLLIIALISGGLLAILNDVLYVSANERTSRSIQKIYGEKIDITEDEIILDVDGANENKNKAIEYDFGKINKIFDVREKGDLLFQTTGYNGYKNGTVTLWIKVTVLYSAAVVGSQDVTYDIDKVILQSYEKQTLMNNFSQNYFENFKLTDITENYKQGNLFHISGGKLLNPNANASYSATACCNAVNCVIKRLGEKKL